MAVPRAVACPRGWFPPATFQLRLRSLRTILYIASPKPRNGHESGFFYVTLHEEAGGASIWTSCRLKWSCDKEERLEWADIDVDHSKVNQGLKSIVIKIWFDATDENGTSVLDAIWGVYFSGLWCLGTHPPAHGRLPPNSLVFHMSGSYFSSASHIRESAGKASCSFIPRYLYIGTPGECQAVKSYDTNLLLYLYRRQRALKQQEANNNRLTRDLRSKGVSQTVASLDEALTTCQDLKKPEIAPIFNPATLPSLRQTVFASKFKLPETRSAEQRLSARSELLRLRISLLQKERDKRRHRIDDVLQKAKSYSIQIEEKTSAQMQYYHSLSKEKAAFKTWLEQFKIDRLTNDTWQMALRQDRLSLIGELPDVFPLSDLGSKRPTLRWITLPPTDEIRESVRDDTQLSVVVGDVAHAIFVIARILDVPLRYQIKLMGSTTSILDEVKVFSEQDLKKDSGLVHGEFPLFLKNSSTNEWSKFEYALYLLNKNLAQLRWQCGLITADLKPTLLNLHEIIAMGQRTPRCIDAVDSLPNIITKSIPPAGYTEAMNPKIVIKNGRATISGAVRKSSSALIDHQPTTMHLLDDIQETQFRMDESILSSSSTSNQSSSALSEGEHPAPKSPQIEQKEVLIGEPPSPKLEASPDISCPLNDTKSSSGNESLSPHSNVLWTDVASRANALSMKKTSFQRPRAHHF